MRFWNWNPWTPTTVFFFIGWLIYLGIILDTPFGINFSLLPLGFNYLKTWVIFYGICLSSCLLPIITWLGLPMNQWAKEMIGIWSWSVALKHQCMWKDCTYWFRLGIVDVNYFLHYSNAYDLTQDNVSFLMADLLFLLVIFYGSLMNLNLRHHRTRYWGEKMLQLVQNFGYLCLEYSRVICILMWAHNERTLVINWGEWKGVVLSFREGKNVNYHSTLVGGGHSAFTLINLEEIFRVTGRFLICYLIFHENLELRQSTLCTSVHIVSSMNYKSAISN